MAMENIVAAFIEHGNAIQHFNEMISEDQAKEIAELMDSMAWLLFGFDPQFVETLNNMNPPIPSGDVF